MDFNLHSGTNFKLYSCVRIHTLGCSSNMLSVPRNSVSIKTIQLTQMKNSSAFSQSRRCLMLEGETGFATLPISASQSDALADVNLSQSRLQCCRVFYLQHRKDKERAVYLPVLLLSTPLPLHVSIMQRQSNIQRGFLQEVALKIRKTNFPSCC